MTQLLTILDIGARGGPHHRWTHIPDVTVIGVDADTEECARLNALTFPVPTRFLAAALGRTRGPATLYVTKQPGCSSLLKPNQAYLSQFPYGAAFAVERTVPLTLTRLDDLCAAHAIVPDVIKIDTQGTELDILLGGDIALQHASIVELEVEFNPLYEGQPLFGDCDAFLRELGFTLLGLRRTAWRRDNVGSQGGTIVHGDALWIREPDDLEARARFARALTAYHQHDYVAVLGMPAPDPRSLPQRLVGAILAQITGHREWRGWLDSTRMSAVDWHDPDFF